MKPNKPEIHVRGDVSIDWLNPPKVGLKARYVDPSSPQPLPRLGGAWHLADLIRSALNADKAQFVPASKKLLAAFTLDHLGAFIVYGFSKLHVKITHKYGSLVTEIPADDKVRIRGKVISRSSRKTDSPYHYYDVSIIGLDLTEHKYLAETLESIRFSQADISSDIAPCQDITTRPHPVDLSFELIGNSSVELIKPTEEAKCQYHPDYSWRLRAKGLIEQTEPHSFQNAHLGSCSNFQLIRNTHNTSIFNVESSNGATFDNILFRSFALGVQDFAKLTTSSDPEFVGDEEIRATTDDIGLIIPPSAQQTETFRVASYDNRSRTAFHEDCAIYRADWQLQEFPRTLKDGDHEIAYRLSGLNDTSRLRDGLNRPRLLIESELAGNTPHPEILAITDYNLSFRRSKSRYAERLYCKNFALDQERNDSWLIASIGDVLPDPERNDNFWSSVPASVNARFRRVMIVGVHTLRKSGWAVRRRRSLDDTVISIREILDGTGSHSSALRYFADRGFVVVRIGAAAAVLIYRREGESSKSDNPEKENEPTVPRANENANVKVEPLSPSADSTPEAVQPSVTTPCYQRFESGAEMTSEYVVHLVFDKNWSIEHLRDTSRQGYLVGMGALFVAAYTKAVADQSQSKNSAPSATDSISLMIEASKKSLASCRKDFELGYGLDPTSFFIAYTKRWIHVESLLYEQLDFSAFQNIQIQSIPQSIPTEFHWSILLASLIGASNKTEERSASIPITFPANEIAQLEDSWNDVILPIAIKLVKYGIKKSFNGGTPDAKKLPITPIVSYGDLTLIGRYDIESYSHVVETLRKHISSNERKPVSIGVFGPPGSGKSFGVGEIAKALCGPNLEILNFNISQYDNRDQLIFDLIKISDVAARGKIPLAFFDEFDCRKPGQENAFWFPSFLQPMQDGTFVFNGSTVSLGPAILVFAGGVHDTREDFDVEHLVDRSSKGFDFSSRLAAHLNINGLDSLASQQTNGLTPFLRRAVLMRSFLKRNGLVERKSGIAQIDIEIITKLLQYRYKYGARSMGSILKLHVPYAGVIRATSCPDGSSIQAHLNPESGPDQDLDDPAS